MPNEQEPNPLSKLRLTQRDAARDLIRTSDTWDGPRNFDEFRCADWPRFVAWLTRECRTITATEYQIRLEIASDLTASDAE